MIFLQTIRYNYNISFSFFLDLSVIFFMFHFVCCLHLEVEKSHILQILHYSHEKTILFFFSNLILYFNLQITCLILLFNGDCFVHVSNFHFFYFWYYFGFHDFLKFSDGPNLFANFDEIKYLFYQNSTFLGYSTTYQQGLQHRFC